MPQFSLVVATFGRTDEIERLFSSLTRQDTLDFEVIVVDQNPDDRLAPAIAKFQTMFQLEWLRCPPGVSRARNLGLARAAGEIIAFPDDDCWYSPGLLKNIGQWFGENPGYSIFATGAKDEKGEPSGNRWVQDRCDLHPVNIFRTTFCSSLFFRDSPEMRKAAFDQTIGPGVSKVFACGEDTDYVMQLMSLGLKGRFDRDWHVGHPRRDMLSSSIEANRAIGYGRGMGYVLKKHSLMYLWVVLLGYDLLRAVLVFLRGRMAAASLCVSHAKGLFAGFAIESPGAAQEHA
jgi:glycosyltransferase involved in cell wall biosynthesis